MKYRKMQGLQNKLLILAALLIIALFDNSETNAQTIEAVSDMEFYESKTRIKKHFQKRDYLFKKEESVLVKYNPLSLSLGGLMHLYQNTISQQLSATCIYQPTCSEFGKRSIKRYGMLKGVFLAADRITRCNKIAALDIHPLTFDEQTHKSKDPIKLYE